MAEVLNGTAGPHAGTNDPAGVTRVIMTGYYDGATNGLLQFGPAGPAFRFDWVDESPGADDSDERTFELRPVSPDALDRFAAAVSPYLTPRWPAWCPAWSFPSDDIRQEVETRTDAILADAGPPEWTITTTDAVTFARFHAHPSAVAASAE